MSEYILKRNLRRDGEVFKVGQPLPEGIDDDTIAIYLEKKIIRKKRVYKPAPKVETQGE
jgi:hypothetical protein